MDARSQFFEWIAKNSETVLDARKEVREKDPSVATGLLLAFVYRAYVRDMEAQNKTPITPDELFSIAI